jgi:hypothetical protein
VPCREPKTETALFFLKCVKNGCQPTNQPLARSLAHSLPASATSNKCRHRAASGLGGGCCFYFVLSWLSGWREPAGRQTETCMQGDAQDPGGRCTRRWATHTGKILLDFVHLSHLAGYVMSCSVPCCSNPLRGKDLWTRRALPRRCLKLPIKSPPAPPKFACLLACSRQQTVDPSKRRCDLLLRRGSRPRAEHVWKPI